jgi:N-acetylmuramoyl-L-alanine amidase
MTIAKQTTKIVVALFMCAAALAASATAFGSDASAENQFQAESLLPPSVIDAAIEESQRPADYRLIPETDSEAGNDRPSDLAALVSLNSADVASDGEEKCLASAIFYEARSEPFEGQLAVAQVILNRVKSGRFATSICGVVLQPGQFSFVRSGSIPAVAKNSRDWREAVAIARIAQARLHNSSASNALFFHASHVNPKWRLSRVASIGNHIFYR